MGKNTELPTVEAIMEMSHEETATFIDTLNRDDAAELALYLSGIVSGQQGAINTLRGQRMPGEDTPSMDMWFSPGVAANPLGDMCIGILMHTDDSGQPRAYIGMGMGRDRKHDANNIREWGAPFHPSAAECVHRHLSGK